MDTLVADETAKVAVDVEIAAAMAPKSGNMSKSKAVAVTTQSRDDDTTTANEEDRRLETCPQNMALIKNSENGSDIAGQCKYDSWPNRWR